MKNLLAICLLACPAIAMAMPIVSTPVDTVGPFRHNVFHSADTHNGAGGELLAWFDLNTAMSSSWDAETGALSLNVNLFSNQGLTSIVGTASATSSNLVAANFNGFDGGIVGSIAWSFDADALAFWSSLGLDLSSGLSMTFIDQNYAANSSGNIANSYENNMMTLWGADGVFNNGVFEGASLGVDMMMQMSEPGILLLMGLGLLGIGATLRRR